MFMTESSFSMKAVEKRIVLFIKFRVYFGIISSLPVLSLVHLASTCIGPLDIILWADPDYVPSIFQGFFKFVFQVFQTISGFVVDFIFIKCLSRFPRMPVKLDIQVSSIITHKWEKVTWLHQQFSTCM